MLRESTVSYTHLDVYKRQVLPDLGRDEACMGIQPVTAPSAEPRNAPCLEYKVFLPKVGKTTVCLGILPDVYKRQISHYLSAVMDKGCGIRCNMVTRRQNRG